MLVLKHATRTIPVMGADGKTKTNEPAKVASWPKFMTILEQEGENTARLVVGGVATLVTGAFADLVDAIDKDLGGSGAVPQATS